MMSKEKTWISLLFSLALFVCLAGLHPVLAADDVIVTFTVKNSWQNETGTGYQYEVALKNESTSAVSGWNFVLDMGADGSYDQSWCCNTEVTGQLLSVTPLDWNSTIGAGSEISGIGIVLMPGLWRDMLWNIDNSVLCVAASDYYDEHDYIRDYDEYLAYLKSKKEEARQ